MVPDPADELLLTAFGNLSTERSRGWDMGPIPASKITDYFERKGFSPDVVDECCLIIRVMDDAFVKWHDAQQQQDKG